MNIYEYMNVYIHASGRASPPRYGRAERNFRYASVYAYLYEYVHRHEYVFILSGLYIIKNSPLVPV